MRAWVVAGTALVACGGVGSADGLGADTAADSDDAGGTDSGNGNGADGSSSSGAPVQPLHRLNRLEYDNTVRDLLQTTLRPSHAFGPDPEANGFDNMAEQLRISSALIDAYDAAAHAVIDDALAEVPVFVESFQGDALAVEGGYSVGSLQALNGNTLALEVTETAQFEAEVLIYAGISVTGAGPQPRARLRVDGVAVADFEVEGAPAELSLHTFSVPFEAGTHRVELIPLNFVNEPGSGAKTNNIFLSEVRVQSRERGPGPGRGLVYVCEPERADGACYTEIIQRFATRAWRRPLRFEERGELFDLWSAVLGAGEEPEQALRLVMRAVMLSPKFFARVRTSEDADHEGWLDDYVLASRLSYFLWSSMPDARLFDMAAQGRLSTSEGLSEAVAFMLDDPKAQGLLDGFAEQWLSTRHLGAFSPIPEVFAGFDDEVREGMVDESKAFFSVYLEGGYPVSSMLNPSFAVRSDRLSSHYGLEPVGSDDFVVVEAGPGDRRGLMTLGAWLTSTSHPDRGSPIRRGHWVSDRILCRHVPPPPPGLDLEVPDLERDETVREALERHRDDPSCSVCHAELDIVGIGFEEYNGVAAPILDPSVDNLGELFDGRTFNGAEEFAALHADSPDFVGCMTKKLFVYATGRAISSYDGPQLDRVAADAWALGYDLPALINAIVQLPSFRGPAPLEDSP